MPTLPNPAQVPTLTVDQTAQVLNIGRSAAYDAIARGEIPALRFGRSIRVPTAALLELLHLS